MQVPYGQRIHSSEPLAALNGMAALLGFIGSIREKKLVAVVAGRRYPLCHRREPGIGDCGRIVPARKLAARKSKPLKD